LLTGVGGEDEVDGFLGLVVEEFVEELRVVEASLLPSGVGVPSGLMFVSGVQGLEGGMGSVPFGGRQHL
jgi:hypothetical protein